MHAHSTSGSARKATLAAAAVGALACGGAVLAVVQAGGGVLQALAALAIGAVAAGFVADRVQARARREHAALRAALRKLAEGEAPPASLPEIEPASELGEDARLLHALGARLASRAQHVLDLAQRIEALPGELAEAAAESGAASARQEAAVEETASLQLHINHSIRDINAEVESLARSNDETASSILEMSGSIDQVASSAADVQQTVEASTSSIHQLGESIRRVATSGDTVQQMAEETAVSIAEMDRSIQQVGVHVRDASGLTSQASASAEEGSRAVGATIDGIAEIRGLSGEAREALGTLAGGIGEIGEIATVIGAISDETNLLSLNAAIIAAQAGEHGKPFAVVAEQVKTLAQRTTQSTREIERLIQAVQGHSENAVRAMEAGAAAVEEGVARSRRAGEALERIRTLAGDASERVAEIASAADEQGRNSRQLADTALQTSEQVHRISDAVTEHAQASANLLENAHHSAELCRVVARATQEQRETGRYINGNIEAITELIRSIQRNTRSHEETSRAVVENFESLIENARKGSGPLQALAPLVEELRSRAAAAVADVKGDESVS